MQNNKYSKKVPASRVAPLQQSSTPVVRQPRPTNKKSLTAISATSPASKITSLAGKRIDPISSLPYGVPDEFDIEPYRRAYQAQLKKACDDSMVAAAKRKAASDKIVRHNAKDPVTQIVHSKFEHGSLGRKIYNHIRGAAGIAMKLAPAALKLAPLLLAAHPATQNNAINSGDVKSVMDARAAFTLKGPVSYTAAGLQNASPISYSNPFEGTGIIGLNNYSPISKKGLVSGARIRGCDKVLDIAGYDIVNALQWAEGDLIVSLDLNPTGDAFQGTALYQQVSVYNRYQVHNMAFVYVPNVPTTTSGGLIMSITPDPDSQYTGSGVLGAQLAMAVDGADPFSIFQAGCVAWAGDKKQKFYARPDGTDPRFTSPGILNIICNTQILPPGAATTDYIAQIGSLYCMYDITVTERSLEDSNRIQNWVACSVSGAAGLTPSLPYGPVANTQNGFTSTNVRGFLNSTGATYPWIAPLVNHPGGAEYGGPTGSLSRIIQYSSVGGLAALSGFPVGFYQISQYVTGTGFTSCTMASVNTGNVYYSAFSAISTIITGSTQAAGYALLVVTKQTTSDEAYLRISVTGTTVTGMCLYISRLLDCDPYNAVAPSVLAITNLQNEVDEMREKMGLPTRAKVNDTDVFGRRFPRGHGKPITFPDIQPLSSLGDDDTKLSPTLELYNACHPDRVLPELGSLVPLDHVRGFSTVADPFWRMENKSQIGSLLSKGKVAASDLAAVVFSTTRKDDKYPYRVVVLPSNLVSTTDTHFVHSANYQAACRYMPVHASV